MKIKKVTNLGIKEVVDITVSNSTYISNNILHHNCNNCKELWHTENINVPRVYKMSELKGGYNKDKKNPIPTVLATHPDCTHSLSLLVDGFGFDESGKIVWVGKGHSEYNKQRS